LEQNLLIENDINLDDAAVGRTILKYNHIIILGDVKYITYIDREDFLQTKSYSVPIIVYLKMAVFSSNELDTEPALLKD
jgi:hypothetical protein